MSKCISELKLFARALSALLACFVLVTCGGGGGSGSDDGGNGGGGSGGNTVTLSGLVFKGPLVGATVQLFEMNDDGERLTDVPLAESVTNEQGEWQAQIPTARVDLRVEVSGGFYVDEADSNPDPLSRRQISLGSSDTLIGILRAGDTHLTLSALTHSLFLAAQRRRQPSDFLLRLALEEANFTDVFGLDVSDAEALDPAQSAAVADSVEAQYSLILGGLANILNAMAINLGEATPEFPLLEALIDDLSDCRLDGTILDDPILFRWRGQDRILPTGLDFNTEILRFRNNNIGSFINVSLPVINDGLCGEIVLPDDQNPPVFTSVPADFTVDAESALGTSRLHPMIVSQFALATAIDDVTDPVVITNNAPSVLPLGSTLVTITALDEAGNASVVTVTITVEDLSAPTILAPADRRVTATGALTSVVLGSPMVSDNVSADNDIQIANDAPIGGFSLGTHTVTWTATDEVGLSSQDTQTVVVENALPTVVSVLSDINVTEGDALNLNLSVGFNDVDSVLTYELSTLPSGTGLTFNSVSGNLQGTLSSFDAAASPLSLTVTARDEVNSVSQTFAITIANTNNAPSFTVSGTLDLLEDFSGTASVSVTLDPISPDETGEIVTFSLSPAAASIGFANVSFNSVTGVINVTALPDANGSVTFTLTADDGQAQNSVYSQDIDLVVTSVNDPPRFTLSGDLVLPRNFVGTQVVTITPLAVPADELSQAVTYSLSPLSVGFANISVSQSPSEIRVTAQANQEGSQLFVVSANDGQGNNSTYTQTFNLIVSSQVSGKTAPPVMRLAARPLDPGVFAKYQIALP